MPKIGDCIYAKQLGFKSETTYIWSACAICGKERWVQKHKGEPRWKHCRHCGDKYVRRIYRNKEHYNWKGGITASGCGYLLETIGSDSPYFSMVKTIRSNRVLQHRLVMARHLGRCLKTNEIVHHLNGVKGDNRIKNLLLSSLKDHEHNTLNRALQARIRELEGMVDK